MSELYVKNRINMLDAERVSSKVCSSDQRQLFLPVTTIRITGQREETIDYLKQLKDQEISDGHRSTGQEIVYGIQSV
jgi:hypothetical protein